MSNDDSTPPSQEDKFSPSQTSSYPFPLILTYPNYTYGLYSFQQNPFAYSPREIMEIPLPVYPVQPKTTSLRKGKWTPEEEKLTNKIIETFNDGTLWLPESVSGITLRAYLSAKLGCDPMRITKKYTGAQCLGKRVYNSDFCNASPEVLQRVKQEIEELEAKFRRRLSYSLRDIHENCNFDKQQTDSNFTQLHANYISNLDQLASRSAFPPIPPNATSPAPQSPQLTSGLDFSGPSVYQHHSHAIRSYNQIQAGLGGPERLVSASPSHPQQILNSQLISSATPSGQATFSSENLMSLRPTYEQYMQTIGSNGPSDKPSMHGLGHTASTPALSYGTNGFRGSGHPDDFAFMQEHKIRRVGCYGDMYEFFPPDQSPSVRSGQEKQITPLAVNPTSLTPLHATSTLTSPTGAPANGSMVETGLAVLSESFAASSDVPPPRIKPVVPSLNLENTFPIVTTSSSSSGPEPCASSAAIVTLGPFTAPTSSTWPSQRTGLSSRLDDSVVIHGSDHRHGWDHDEADGGSHEDERGHAATVSTATGDSQGSESVSRRDAHHESPRSSRRSSADFYQFPPSASAAAPLYLTTAGSSGTSSATCSSARHSTHFADNFIGDPFSFTSYAPFSSSNFSHSSFLFPAASSSSSSAPVSSSSSLAAPSFLRKKRAQDPINSVEVTPRGDREDSAHLQLGLDRSADRFERSSKRSESADHVVTTEEICKMLAGRPGPYDYQHRNLKPSPPLNSSNITIIPTFAEADRDAALSLLGFCSGFAASN